MRDSGRYDKTQPNFQVHVSQRPRRGSKLLTAVFAVIILGGGGAAAWFASDDQRLLDHLRRQDDLAAPAVYVLAWKGMPAEARDPLIDALDGASSPRLRAAAASALGGLRDRRNVSYLGAAALDDPDPGVREAAVEALGASGESSAGKYITRALQDEAIEVEAAACDAAGQLLLEEHIPLLIDELGRPYQPVRSAALRALERYTEGDLTFSMDRKAWMDWYGRNY